MRHSLVKADLQGTIFAHDHRMRSAYETTMT